MAANHRQQAVHGLIERIDWLARKDRSNEEIVKTVEVLVDTAEQYVRKDALEEFYQELAKLKPNEQE